MSRYGTGHEVVKLGCPGEALGGRLKVAWADLFGFFTHSGFPVIQAVIGPGALARRTAASFYQDALFLRRIGDELRKHHGLQHIGEWHSHHHLGLDQPSLGDANTVVRAVEGNGLHQFFLAIATLRREGEFDVPSVRGHLFCRQTSEVFVSCGWVVLPGTSPVRSDARVAEVLRESPPRTTGTRCRAVPRTTLESPSDTLPLPADSWARTPSGTKLFKLARDRIARHADVRFGVTPEGLVEAQWSLGAKSWKLAFSNGTSMDRASATLQWSRPAPTGEVVLSGSLPDVLASVDELLEEPDDFEINEDTMLELVPQETAMPPSPGRLVRGEQTRGRVRRAQQCWFDLLGRIVAAIRRGGRDASEPTAPARRDRRQTRGS